MRQRQRFHPIRELAAIAVFFPQGAYRGSGRRTYGKMQEARTRMLLKRALTAGEPE